jgi:hypothetical protein
VNSSLLWETTFSLSCSVSLLDNQFVSGRLSLSRTCGGSISPCLSFSSLEKWRKVLITVTIRGGTLWPLTSGSGCLPGDYPRRTLRALARFYGNGNSTTTNSFFTFKQAKDPPGKSLGKTSRHSVAAFAFCGPEDLEMDRKCRSNACTR